MFQKHCHYSVTHLRLFPHEQEAHRVGEIRQRGRTLHMLVFYKIKNWKDFYND